MIVLVISQSERIGELNSFVSWLSERANSKITLLCPGESFFDQKSKKFEIEVKPFLTQGQLKKVNRQNRFDQFRYIIIRFLRRGSFAGVIVEKLLVAGIRVARRVRSVSQIKSNYDNKSSFIGASKVAWVSPYHQQLLQTLKTVHSEEEITRIEVFDLQDLATITGFAEENEIDFQIR